MADYLKVPLNEVYSWRPDEVAVWIAYLQDKQDREKEAERKAAEKAAQEQASSFSASFHAQHKARTH